MTQAQLQKLRRSMGEAMWGARAGRNAGAALLLVKPGMGDPHVARAGRMARHWAKQVHWHRWQDLGGEENWPTRDPCARWIRGPGHMMKRVLNEVAVTSPDGVAWHTRDGEYRADALPDLNTLRYAVELPEARGRGRAQYRPVGGIVPRAPRTIPPIGRYCAPGLGVNGPRSLGLLSLGPLCNRADGTGRDSFGGGRDRFASVAFASSSCGTPPTSQHSRGAHEPLRSS